MTWLIVAVGYLLGSIPTAYIAGRLVRGKDIREIGDGNMGAQNAFRQLGPAVGIIVGVIDAAKGCLAIMVAQVVGLSQLAVFVTGGAAVVGHNWPFSLGFRGGRGEATTIGILLTLVTVPMLIVSIPGIIALILSRHVTLASAVLFIPLPFVCWWQGVSWAVIAYSLMLFFFLAFRHILTTRRIVPRHA